MERDLEMRSSLPPERISLSFLEVMVRLPKSATAKSDFSSQQFSGMIIFGAYECKERRDQLVEWMVNLYLDG